MCVGPQGEHYTDCAIQAQGNGCNCHFEKPSYQQVHGPVIAMAAMGLLARANASFGHLGSSYVR
jgi:hypothetical protein